MLDDAHAKKYEYNGKKYTRYDAKQLQRGMERKIRKFKRASNIADAMGLADKKEFYNRKVTEWQTTRAEFCKSTGLHKDAWREKVGKDKSKVGSTGSKITIDKNGGGDKIMSDSAISLKSSAVSASANIINAGDDTKVEAIFNKIDNSRLELDKVSEAGKILLVKYARDMEAELNYDAKKSPCYSPLGNKIYLNIDAVDERDRALGFTKHTRCFLHEVGHWLDYNALGKGKTIHGELKDLRKFIESDILKKCNESNKGYKYKTLKDALNYRQRDINNSLHTDRDLKDGVSDIYEGATKGKIGGHGNNNYGHGVEYWKGDALEKEAIANMFEVFANGGKRVEYMEEYLSTAFKYFCDFISKL